MKKKITAEDVTLYKESDGIFSIIRKGGQLEIKGNQNAVRFGFWGFAPNSKLRKIKTAVRFWEGESRRLSPAQGIGAVSF
jgi:hypothetical protein